jgi:Flp pilus assembly protein protease CpaA
MSMSWLDQLLNPATFPILIPIAAIVVGGVVVVVKVLTRHRERMAMIERGMHPDHHVDESAFSQDDRRA